MKNRFLVVSSIVLIASLLAVVACGTRSTRQTTNAPDSSLAPQGKFELDKKTQVSDECVPMNDGLDKDLKVGDKAESSFSIKSPYKEFNFTSTEEIVEISNSLVRSKGLFKMADGKEIAVERSCEAVGDGKWACQESGEGLSKEAKNFTCEIKNQTPDRNESAGTYKIAGQSIAVNRRVITFKGPIECKNGDKVESLGNGTAVFEEFTATEVVKFPSSSAESKMKPCQESVFTAMRITSDDGKEIFTYKSEITSAPIRKK